MPRATRTSQAALASAVEPDESLRAFYNSTAAVAGPTTTNVNNDPIWTGRRSSNRRTTATAATSAGLANSTSNLTDLSVSVSSASASLNSPIHSSHGGSEASSYAAHGVPGVIDEGNEEDNQQGEEEEDSDEDVVVVRSSTAGARHRHRILPSSNSAHDHNHSNSNNNNNEEDEDDAQMNYHASGTNDEIYMDPERSNDTNQSNFSSRLLDESEEDEVTNAPNNGGGGNLNGSEIDELAHASNEEVELRAMEGLQWEYIGDDKRLYEVNLERWKIVSGDSVAAGKFKEPGTVEYKSLQAIQAKLLTAVQELENTEWMYAEPLPFTSYLPEPSSTIGHKLPTSLPFGSGSNSTQNPSSRKGGNDDNAWSDRAFNPLSTFTPLAPVGQATYPDTYRVQRALGALPLHKTTASEKERGGSATRRSNITDGNARRDREIGYHGNAIPRRRPDFTWLDSEANNILGDQEKSFAAKGKFPWATALSSSSTATASANRAAAEDEANGEGDLGRNTPMVRGSSMSLTREVGTIRLQ